MALRQMEKKRDRSDKSTESLGSGDDALQGPVSPKRPCSANSRELSHDAVFDSGPNDSKPRDCEPECSDTLLDGVTNESSEVDSP